ncbi:MAG: PQQ-binding-like beta-propeller repeat protein [Myxococcales bacterium]|nr:PQQ-binding-like beta-propeller repeat protein [Myxococcales bacterium]
MKRLHSAWIASLFALGCIEAPGKLTLEEYLIGVPDVTGDVNRPDASFNTDTPSDDEVDESETVDGSDSTDDGDVTVDPDVEPDTGPVCVPHPLGTDFCNGADDDCDGETDEEAHPPKAVADFKAPAGWRRSSPLGETPHNIGPIPFRGLADVGAAVWTRTAPWQGDVDFDVRLVLSSVGSGAEWFIGTFAGPTPLDATAKRSGFSMRRASATSVKVDVIVDSTVVGSGEVTIGSFLGAIYRLSTANDRVLLRLQKGDGSAVLELDLNTTGLVPSHDGLVISALGGPVLGNVSRYELDGTPECTGEAAPDCTTCEATEPCTTAFCNPFLGCDTMPVLCGAATACSQPGVCDPGTGLCSASTPVNEGQACEVAEACTAGALCSAGSCVGGTPKTCDSPNGCQEAGTCQAYLGCVYPVKPDGTGCDDGSLCTTPDTCADGLCEGTASVVCPEDAPCKTPSTCDSATGVCSEVVPEPDGATCDDGDACTGPDSCLLGICSSSPLSCDDGSPCTLDACVAGECTHTASLDCAVWTADVADVLIGLPLAASNGTVVVIGQKAGGTKALYAVDAAGTLVWTTEETVQAVTTSPALSTDESTLVVGDATGGVSRIVALNLSGQVLWSFPIPGDCSAVPNPCDIMATPTVYGNSVVVSTRSALISVESNPDGQGAFAPAQGSTIAEHRGAGSSAVITGTGALYVGEGGDAPGIRSVSGAFWVAPAPVQYTPMSLDGVGQLIATSGPAVAAISTADGKLETAWSVLGAATVTAPLVTVGASGIVAVAGATVSLIDSAVCPTDPNTCTVWTVTLPATAGPGLAVLADATILVPLANGTVALLDATDGETTLTLPTGAASVLVPLLLNERLILPVGGKLIAIPHKAGIGLDASPWPVTGKSQRRNTAP